MRTFELRNIYKTVATAGTQERLTSDRILTPYLIVSAEVSNTGNIYVGDADVSATDAFVELDAGQRIQLDPKTVGGMKGYFDLSQIWVDASVNTDGAYFGYLVEKETD